VAGDRRDADRGDDVTLYPGVTPRRHRLDTGKTSPRWKTAVVVGAGGQGAWTFTVGAGAKIGPTTAGGYQNAVRPGHAVGIPGRIILTENDRAVLMNQWRKRRPWPRSSGFDAYGVRAIRQIVARALSADGLSSCNALTGVGACARRFKELGSDYGQDLPVLDPEAFEPLQGWLSLCGVKSMRSFDRLNHGAKH